MNGHSKELWKIRKKTLKCLDVPQSWISGFHTQGHEAIPKSLSALCFSRVPRSIATYFKKPLLQTQVVQQLQLRLFREGRRQELGLPLLSLPKDVPAAAGGQLCAGTSLSPAWAWSIMAIPHFSLLVFVLETPDCTKYGKTFEILEVFRSWETSGWKLVPTGGIGQCKEETVMLF